MTAKKILCICILIAASVRCFAQIHYDFEQGLSGWVTVGKVAIGSVHQGSNSAVIGTGYGSVSKRINGNPLAIVSFEAHVKTSGSTVKAYSFIRFLDVKNKQLMIYKSKAVSSTNYEQTGNYAETPPGTRYIEIGIDRDSSGNGFVYVDDFKIENNADEPRAKHQPLVDLDQYMRPFWKSDTIYNETVLLFSENGQSPKGKLLYMPGKILSVKKFDLHNTYHPDIDYTINGNVIMRTQNSGMPFRADTSFYTKKTLAWYNLQSQWVVVTYIHHDQWNGPVPQYKGERMPHVMGKLKAKMPIKIVAFGMGITRGMDVSSYDTVPPYMPPYASLFAGQLQKVYHDKNIKLYNAGLPGALVDWGAQYADKYINPIKPDLVILDFGMNDFWRYTPEQFKGYIQTIMKKVRAGNPRVEFILLSNMKFDPDYILDSDKNKSFYMSNMDGYNKVLKQMEGPGVVNLDMNTLSGFIYQRKKAKDCIVNPLYPNDYMARWYAQGLAQLLIRGYK